MNGKCITFSLSGNCAGIFFPITGNQKPTRKGNSWAIEMKDMEMEDGIIFGFDKQLHDQPVHTRLYKVRKEKDVQSECFDPESVTSGQYFMQARRK